MSENLVEIHNLQVRRNGRVALEIENLHLRRGETLGVVGPNGAGKSTLLLTLANLLEPARGEIRFDGRSLHQWNKLDYRRRISVVFQSPLLLDLTVEQNIALGLKFRGVPRDEIRTRVERWMKYLGVESLSKRRADRLSGGEAQRVSLARAFVLDPDLLLLDEPFAALDPPTRAKLLDDLSGILKADHKTAVFVTHNLNEAAKLSHRIAVIVDGTLRQEGTMEQIRAQPADEIVRAFLSELSQ
ncbi:MAG: ATP-binding cassette domain-containing protein [Chloroflexi bacterium]|nr:ATP-binding cassette domain-containing protein [Chloroflexota bacterium]